MANKPRSLFRRLLVGVGVLLVLVVGVYVVAFNATKSDPAKLGTWGRDLDQALADARKSDKLVLVKAGSEY